MVIKFFVAAALSTLFTLNLVHAEAPKLFPIELHTKIGDLGDFEKANNQGAL